jgi:hypothetical protein
MMGMDGFCSSAGTGSIRLETARANKPASLGHLEKELNLFAEVTGLRGLSAAQSRVATERRWEWFLFIGIEI